jgi:mono/diheme cytochrome c family protein
VRGLAIPALLLTLLSVTHAAAQSPAPEAARGLRILGEHCARCHTLSPSGPSPLQAAPPLREVYDRFAPRDLRAMLLQGMVSRHREMPQVELTPEDADAVLAALYSLAGGK